LKKNQTIAYVEIKSCTHVENGVAKFPDRPTERGRRHLKKLIKLARNGISCYVVFIIQRPDARIFSPFREVDAQFAELLKEAYKAGVIVRAMTTEFDPRDKTIYLMNPHLPLLII
jgi:sugar fermentation stimulation protein A